VTGSADRTADPNDPRRTTVASRVAILDDYQGAALEFGDWAQLPADTEVVPFHDHVGDDDALASRLAGFDVVVAMRERTPFPRARLERLPDLRLLVTTGIFNAAIDMDAARDLGIVVAGTGGILSPTAELTWGLLLALARHIPQEDRNVREGGWQASVGTDLAGATLGLVGLGNLGALVATVGRAFAMDVIAWSQNLTPERANQVGVRRVEKDEVFETADFLSVHLVLSDRSRGLIGGRELSLMKPTAFLVNTSRGPIVDEVALISALEQGQLAGAGVDVFDQEPLPSDHPFRRLPNVITTPHIGYVTRRCYKVFYRDIVEDIAAYLRGEPIRVANAA
jgi:phosphoglycerate dehydrogenase-like enzyme